jgi:signal transduction histidine kinase
VTTYAETGRLRGRGIALRCDESSRIEGVIRNELGVDEEWLLGQPLRGVVDDPSREAADELLSEVAALGAAFNRRVVLVARDRALPLFFSGVLESNGRILLVGEREDQPEGGAIEEITRLNNDLANMQRRVAKNNAELARLNEQKNLWLGMAAHDLRTPLGAIMSFSEFILEEDSSSLAEHHREFLRLIRDSSKSMLNLVNDLLDISQIEAGKLRLQPQEQDFQELVERYVGLSRPLAERRGLRLTLESCGAFPPVCVDADKFGQVLNNLLDNAMRFSPDGGEVRVIVLGAPGAVDVLISDEGPGIPQDRIATIFEPFKTDHRGKAERGGTGLGLAIVKRIVEGHRGEIFVDSELGRGTTFRVRLPVDAPCPSRQGEDRRGQREA